MPTHELPFAPVCDPVPDTVLSSLLFYAPIALNFIYAEREVDMQLLAAQQGWRILYAHLQQDCHSEGPISDRPASALFLHKEQKIACFAVRGTTTINDVVTDIRQLPVPFPETETDVACAGGNARFDDDWTPIFRGQGLAVCGMARAAVNLYREHIDVLVLLVKHGYRLRITGHSLGGGVATLLGALVLRHFEQTAKQEGPDISSSEHVPIERSDLLRVYGYGSPSCVDAELSDYVKSFVTTVVLHDDVIPRLTPTSIRGLLKHLLHIRETWVKMHLADDLRAISDRAKTAWAPRWRGSFTIGDSSSVKRYCRKQIQNGKKKLLLSVKSSVVGKTILEENREERKSLQEEPDFCNSAADLNVQQSTDQPSVGFMRDDSTMDFEFERNSSTAEEEYMPEEEARGAELGTTLLVDYMGGIDKRTEGLVIDGDEFFDTEETLIENEDEESTEDNLSLLGPIPLER
jgi:Lipase (class 3)